MSCTDDVFNSLNKSFNCLANPKGWAFFVALLPPIIDYQLPITTQIIILPQRY